MKKFDDFDRLKTSIKNDVVKSIRDDSHGITDGISDGINQLINSTGSRGKIQNKRTDKGSLLSVKAEVPSDNASLFVSGVDNIVHSVFRFDKWSDMEI